VLLLAGGIGAFLLTRPPAARADVLLHTVKKESLNVTVTEKGQVESADNRDVVCKVRAGSKGFASTINWVIEDGAKVEANQLVMILDDSALQDQARAQRITLDQAFALKVKAEKDYEITIEENERLIAEAENQLLVAEIDLDKFGGLTFDPDLTTLAAVAGAPSGLAEGGDYKRQVDDLTGQVRLAESDVQQNQERAAWADRMVRQKYMSAAQAQAERSRLESSNEKYRSLTRQRELLLQYDRKKLLADFRSKVDNATRLVRQKELEASAKNVQAEIERKTKRSIYAQEGEKLKEIEDQIKECRIYAPQGGLVVYFKNESSRFSSNQSGLIEQGAQVKEGQKMLRIPNLDRMQVNTKVHEAMVSRIKGDIRVSTGLIARIRAGQLTTIDPFSRLVSQHEDVVGDLGERYRDHEYRTARKGQKASIRIDAFPDQLFPGRVRVVAGVASQTDSWVSDVKVYQTLVQIDDVVSGLKPDMTAEVTIHIDGLKDVMTVPLQAVVGGAELGAKRKVFVRTPTGYDEREVTLGLMNDRVVEVREGLAEGEEVVLNPRVLLGDTRTKTRDGAGPGGEGKGEGGKGGPGGDKKAYDPSKKKGGGAPGGAPGGGGPPGGA
jgi:HlyD family secretion protein